MKEFLINFFERSMHESTAVEGSRDGNNRRRSFLHYRAYIGVCFPWSSP